MHNTVAILLNEREQQKKELAEALAQGLSAAGITSSRIPSSENIVEKIRALKPAVIILDYILEDYGTGLDLLDALTLHENLHQPACIFLTDEPSRAVAVSAFKLGATDYFYTGDVSALHDCIEQIRALIVTREQSERAAETVRSKFRPRKDLVLSSQSISDALDALILEFENKPRLIALCGPIGSGKRTLAATVMHQHKLTPLLADINTIEPPFHQALTRTLRLHSSFGDNTKKPCWLWPDVRLETIQRAHEFSLLLQNIQKGSSKGVLPILITTTDIRVARWLEESLSAPIIVVPGLREGRTQEIEQLVQKFLFEAAALFKVELPRLSARELGWFTEQAWEENISQLKRVVESFVVGQHVIRGDSIEEKLDRLLNIDRHKREQPRALLKRLIRPEHLLETLIVTGGSFSQSAALLGTSVADLLSAVQTRGEGNHESS